MTASGLTIKSTLQEGIALVKVAGSIDMLTSPDLIQALVPFFQPSTVGIIVDLSRVSFMDSAGVATLVEGLKWGRRDKRRFILAGPAQTVFNALNLTKLEKVFFIEPDTQTALAGLTHWVNQGG